MRVRLIMCPVVLLFVVSMCGCAALNERRNDAMRQHSDIESLKLDVSRLKDRLEGIEAAQDTIHGEIADLGRSRAKDNDQVKQGLAEINRKIDLLDRAREKLRQEIVDTLSRKIADVMKRGQAASRPRVQEGLEHVVKPGETLSEISSAYGVPVKTIIKVNNIKRPDQIRAGQKLFIPE
jgi:LysM repeat protein